MSQAEKLAIHGGKPVREALLPYGSQWIDDHDVEVVVNTLRSPFLTQGPEIAKFEQAVAEVCGAKFAVAFSNGTTALHGASFAAGIGPGDEVITTPLTFAASSNCVLYQGGTPVFADIDPDTYLLDIEKTKEKITSKTKAIIPVDFTGQPVNIQAFMKLAKEHGVVVIVDAAHSLGASFNGSPVGAIADMTMFSFHPVKPVTTAEGGVIVTNSEEYYEKLRLFRSHGITRDERRFAGENEGPWYYEMQALGNNYRLTDLQAALGTSQMGRLQEYIAKRREISKQYDEAFEALENERLLKRPFQAPQAQSGWHLYIIQLQLENLTKGRREIFDALRAENIGVNVHYIPVYRFPYYQGLGYGAGLCPIAEQLYETFITLPLFPKMSVDDVQTVIRAVDKVLRFYAK
ncbi:MAG: UDP-4-amino-4,6-dideoxy-N-acetyl-beta-L-altrosamine transaminase [Clostridia bacterium]